MNSLNRRAGMVLLGLSLYFQGVPPSWDFIYNAIKYRVSEEEKRALIIELADFLKSKGIDSSWALEIIEFFIFRIPSFCIGIAKETVEDLVNKGVKPKVIVDVLETTMNKYRHWIRFVDRYVKIFPPEKEIKITFKKFITDALIEKGLV